MVADAKNMACASQVYLQDPVKASAVGNLPTPKAGSNRNSRKAIMGGHPNHPSKSDLSLGQAVECLEGVLPREVNNVSELPSRFQALFPTPTAQDGTKPRGPNSHRQHDLSGIAKGYWPTPRAGKVNGEDEEVWRKRQAAGGVSTPPLGLAVKMAPPASWPTPRASEWKGTGPNGSKSQKPMLGKGYLCAVVNEVETNGVPPVTDYPTPRGGGGQGVGMCGGTGAYEKLKDLEAKGAITTEERESMASGSGGQLNPDWVEPLMGYRCTTTTLVPEIEAWFKVDAKRLKAADLKKLHELDEAAVVLEDAVEAEDEPVAPKKEAPRGRKKPKP